MNLRFHWMLPKAGEIALTDPAEIIRYRSNSRSPASQARLTDLPGWIRFGQAAQAMGIDSLLVHFGRHDPEPLHISSAVGQAVKRINFMVAHRSGLMQPAAFVHQVNTISGLLQGRISLNIVAGSSTEEQRGYGDFLNHDERYARAGEFLDICHAFWASTPEKGVNYAGQYYTVAEGRLHTPFVASHKKSNWVGPEIYVSGHSDEAESLAKRRASCLVRVLDTPQQIEPFARMARGAGLDVCLRLGIVCRQSREEAVEFVETLLRGHTEEQHLELAAVRNDSQMYREAIEVGENEHWLSPTIWRGFVRYHGPVWMTLIGTPEELARAFLEYKEVGVDQFIISGIPELDAVRTFGECVLPLIRDLEASR